MYITEAVEIILVNSPYLEEALNENLINVSALARHIKPEVEKLTKKDVQENAIIMAVNRRPIEPSIKISKGIRSFMQSLGDIIVRSELSDHTFENSGNLDRCQRQLLDEIDGKKDHFYTFSRGVFETTLVASSKLDETIQEIFKNEKRMGFKSSLSSITVQLPSSNTEIYGVYYFILKQLAWAGINVCEVISTSNEITLVVTEHDLKRAFPTLMELKSKQGSGR